MVSREKMKVLGLFFALGVVMTSTAEAEEGSQLAGGTREALARIDQGKQENEQRAAKLVAEANDLLIRNKYLEARDKYIEAVKIFEQFPSETFRQKTDWCRRQIGKCYSYMAEDAMLLAEDAGIKAYSSPTHTTRYVSLRTKIPFLLRETFYYIGYQWYRLIF